VTTERTARTMALDEKTHRIYLSAAETGPAPEPKTDRKKAARRSCRTVITSWWSESNRFKEPCHRRRRPPALRSAGDLVAGDAGQSPPVG